MRPNVFPKLYLVLPLLSCILIILPCLCTPAVVLGISGPRSGPLIEESLNDGPRHISTIEDCESHVTVKAETQSWELMLTRFMTLHTSEI